MINRFVKLKYLCIVDVRYMIVRNIPRCPIDNHLGHDVIRDVHNGIDNIARKVFDVLHNGNVLVVIDLRYVINDGRTPLSDGSPLDSILA